MLTEVALPVEVIELTPTIEAPCEKACQTWDPEFALNEDLKGRIDKLSGLRDRSGRLIFADGIEDERALAGHNVYLTIDQGIQYTAERELMQSAREFEAAGGSVVVVDPNTGEILALASWPFFT